MSKKDEEDENILSTLEYDISDNDKEKLKVYFVN